MTKNNIAHFQPTDPERISMAAKAEHELAKRLVPQLKELWDLRPPEITVHEGVESYRRFWLESVHRLPAGSTDSIAGSIGEPLFRQYMGNQYETYFAVKEKKKIHWNMILFAHEVEPVAHLKKRFPHDEFRVIAKDVHKLGNFNIFSSHSVVLNSTTEPMVIEVKNATPVKVFQNIFDILWSIGKKL